MATERGYLGMGLSQGEEVEHGESCVGDRYVHFLNCCDHRYGHMSDIINYTV